MAASNTIEIIINAVDHATDKIRGVGDWLDGIGGKLTRVGVGLTAMTAPLAAGLAAATQQAINFEEAMTDIQAVTQQSSEEMEVLSDQVLDLGANSRFGPQAVAGAMYDIVGGVTDATTHMAILEAAISTAQAGNANLGATTSALISIMNSYSFSADQASFASDVLTQIVAKGVGTMDEFAAALPLVAGLAASAGIKFDALGASVAFMTTKGYSASQAVTRIQASITALLNPNERMTRALQAMGVESGSAALEMYGLAGTLGRLDRVLGGSQDAMAEALGSVEALQAAVVLNDESFENFLVTFEDTAAGVTDAAEGIQMQSAAAQIDLLKSQMSALAIEIGEALLPRFRDILETVTPIIRSVIDWIEQNPELTTTIVGIASAAVIAGPALMAIGTAIRVIGSLAGVFATAIGIITSPIFILIAAAGVLLSLLGVDIIGGFQSFVQQIGVFKDRVENMGFEQALTSMLNPDEDGSSFFSTMLEGFGMARDQAQNVGSEISRVLNEIVTTIQNVLPLIPFYVQYYLGGIWDRISSALQPIATWFVEELLPAVVDTFNNHVMPVLETFADFLSDLWTVVAPHLEDLYNWFVEDALPAILDFVTTIFIPGIQGFIDLIAGIWEVVGPALVDFADWFLNDGLPAVVDLVEDVVVPAVQGLIDLVSGIWNSVGPGVVEFAKNIQTWFNWIVENVLIPFIGLIQDILNALASLGTTTTRTPMGSAPKAQSAPKGYSDLGTGTDFYNAGTAFLRDWGGMGLPNTPYMIGTGAQPELFIPRTAGNFYPAGEYGGGQSIQWTGDLIVNGQRMSMSDEEKLGMLVDALELLTGRAS